MRKTLHSGNVFAAAGMLLLASVAFAQDLSQHDNPIQPSNPATRFPAPAAHRAKAAWTEDLGKPGGRERALQRSKEMTERARTLNIQRMRNSGQVRPITPGPMMLKVDPETGELPATVAPKVKNNTSDAQIRRLFPGGVTELPPAK